MFRHHCLLLFCLLFFITAVKSQSRLSDVQPTFLWEVTGKDLPAPTYLFGSLHVLSPQWLDSFPEVRKKFNAADVYVGERILTDFAPGLPDAPTDTPLLSLLRPDQYRFLDSFLKVNFQGASLSDTEAVHMNMVDLLGIVRSHYAEKILRNNDKIRTLDLYLQQESGRRKRRMVGLETEAEVNRRLVRGRSQEMLVDVIIDILKNLADRPQQLQFADELVGQYRALRIPYHFSESSPDPALYEERNRAWMPALLASIRSAGCFVHVGLGHLQYADGLIGLLRRAGYNVRPVPVAGR